MKKIILIALNIFLPLAVFFCAAEVFAQQSATGGDMCGGDALSNLFCNKSLPDMLNALFQLALGIGGILAMLRLSWAGWKYMGAGFDSWGTKQDAKKIFTETIQGLLILLAIWLILYQINPCILQLDLVKDVQNSSAQDCAAKN
jgi:hypothetical protein